MKCASVLTLALSMMATGCEAPARSADFFEAHPKDAKDVLEGCAAHMVRSDECDNARMGASRARAEKSRREAEARARSGNILPTIRNR